MKPGQLVKLNENYILSDDNKEKIRNFMSKIDDCSYILDEFDEIFDDQDFYKKKFVVVLSDKTASIPTKYVMLKEKTKDNCGEEFYIQSRYCILLPPEPTHKLTGVFV